ncbi:MAG: protein kinase [Ardenticatenaceae bacterium]|nr:protein kinase [Ardenticatenaceae bacterium]
MDVQDFFEQPLDDRYRLEELIAEKKYITSYIAYDTQKEQTVAIDFLKAEYAKNKDFVTHYTERINVLAQITHPNLPSVLALGKLPNGSPYTVREYVAGYPLTERLDQLAKQGLPVYSIYALRIIRQVAEALAKLEQVKLFHYALAPENILLKTFTVKSDDAVVVLDLGIPTSITQILSFSTNGNSSHTAYLAPEQTKQEPIDGRSHVYALGVMLYELLTGQLPSKLEGSWEPLVRQVVRGRTALEKARGDLTHETYALVDKCLRREPWQRFPTIEAFIEVLDKAIMAEDVRMRTISDTVFVPRRNQRPFIIIALSLIVVVAVGSTFLLRGLSGNEPPPTRSINAAALSTPLVESIIMPPTATPTSEASATATNAAAVVEATPSATATSELTPSPTAILTPSPSPTVTASPTPQPRVRVVFSSISVRTGPGTHYDTVAFMEEGETAVIIGRSDNQEIWYNIQLDNGSTGWVASSVTEIEGGADPLTIPVAATIPPSPTPTATPTATPTIIPTATLETDDGGSGGGSPKPQPSSTPPPLPTSGG